MIPGIKARFPPNIVNRLVFVIGAVGSVFVVS